MTKLIVSLTVIPPRMSALGPTLQSLISQTERIDEIRLNVPQNYRRKEFGAYTIPDLPDEVNVHIVDFDYGPATKVLPTVKQYEGHDVRILFCDDDRVYDKNWAKRFVTESEKFPSRCIVDEGFNLNRIDVFARYRVKNWAYRLKRGASLGLWKGGGKPKSGVVDILEGFGGVLVKPDFFSDDVFDIPDVLWTVDDTWISGNLARNGIKIWLNPNRPPKKNRSSAASEDDLSSLNQLTYLGNDRISADLACVNYYRKVYGIWGGRQAIINP